MENIYQNIIRAEIHRPWKFLGKLHLIFLFDKTKLWDKGRQYSNFNIHLIKKTLLRLNA